MDRIGPQLISAIQDFHRARARAKIEQILARLTGASAELLNYEEVRQKLKGIHTTSLGLQNIPIDAIIGSVGRYADFTRSFLPRQDEDERRWARVETAMTDMEGLPPVEVYQIGEAYFVLDGNHRVSVAKQLGATRIEAHVTQLHTRVPLTSDDQPEDLIVKAEYAEFLEHTSLDKLRPDADLSTSIPGRYRELEEHISVHRYFMGIEQEREIPYEEAVAHWYDHVYLPVVEIIRQNGILRDFPDRTETDLYLWILRHRDELGQELAWEIRPEVAADDLVGRFSPRLERILARVTAKVRDIALPKRIASGPRTGDWRREREGSAQEARLFARTLVTISGEAGGWKAVDLALEVARREGGRLIGLHVVGSEAQKSTAVRAIQAEFERRCEEANIPAQWVLEAGDVAAAICERGQWLDLVVAGVAHPPGAQPVARLGSGFRTLVQHCPTPVLAASQASSGVNRVLLAYDGSPKADEALFVSTYLAGRWKVDLTVVTVLTGEQTSAKTIRRARRYLERHGIEAKYVTERGPVGKAILQAAEEHGSELIVMGGYSSPVLEIVFGSTVDEMLRDGRYSVLICR
jgi:nucleotide-binding universal stress UspA family protein